MAAQDIKTWIEKIGSTPIPVLKTAIDELKRVSNRENAHIQEMVEAVERDPGLTVFVLRMMNSGKRGRLATEVNSVQQALMMMGTEQLKTLPDKLPNLEQSLQEPARTRLLKTFSRTYHAAQQAVEWARMRRDMTPDEVFAATQLHFLGEMALAIHAPEILDQVDQMCIEQHLPSEEAQYILLGFTLDELTMGLAREWHLPELVVEALQAENARFPRAYGVMLAVQLGRHAAINWYSEKTRSIQDKVAEWLGKEIEDVIANCHQLAASIANTSYRTYQVQPAATLLPLIVAAAGNNEQSQETTGTDSEVEVCLMPQPEIIKNLLNQLNNPQIAQLKPPQIITATLQALHNGLGLNRVVFARLDQKEQRLVAEKIIGSNNDPIFSRFEINLKTPNLFSRLMEKTQAIMINDSNRNKFWSLVPDEIQKKIGVNSFVAMSLYVNNQPLGLIYADRHTSNCQLDDTSYNYFKSVCNQTCKALARLADRKIAI